MGQQTCQTFIDGLEAKYPDFSSSSLTEQEKLYVQYSGIGGIRNIGDRISCEKHPSMNYYVLVHFGTDIFDTRIQVETGICIIKECTKETLSSNKEMMRSLFKFNNFPVTESDIIELYDMHEPISKSVMFYLSTILHIAIVAFSICSTIIIYKRQRQKQRYQTTSITPEASQTQNHWLMEAFEIRATLRALYQTAKEQKQNENIAVFGFLRIFGAYWILSAHAYGMTGAAAISPGTNTIPFSTFFINGPFGVDCFFFMGGLLSVYVLVPKFQKEKLTLRSLFYHMKHRFVRIWPLCMAAVLFYLYVVRYMFTGPMWGRYGIADSCNKFWLSKIFLVDNLVLKGEGGCAVWTWYASVDLQGYIVVLLVVAVYAQSKLRGYIAAGLFMFMSIVIANDRYLGGLTTYYIYTPARVNEMLIGIVFGMHYYEYAKLKEKKNLYWLCERFYVVKYIVLLGGVALWYFVSYHVLQHQMVIDDWTVYSKCLMCLATALTFAPIIAQKPFWLKSFLNLRLWQILGKLSFGIYLFHIPVMYAVLWTRDLPLESFSTSFMTYTTPRTILGATIVAAFYWIFLERPLLAIEAHSNKKPQATSAASANVNEAITILQPASSKLKSDQNDSSIELAAKPLEQKGDSSPKPSKSLGIDKKSYQPLQES